ncbi:MAG: nitrous oxide reductase family maturation protein NosD [Bacteroidia bacterium]|nr:nitrous oxide reductase family maturation protein NosD [Bacteroidia bacterium]
MEPGRCKGISLIFLLTALQVFSSAARTLDAGPGTQLLRISYALSAAVHGDTIRIHGGEYHEGNIIIDKQVVLLGLGRPVVDGDHLGEIFSIKADGVTLDGFRIRNTGVSGLNDYAGIKIYNRKNVIIKNNILENCFFGIYTQYGLNCVVSNNVLRASQGREQLSGNGIHCWKSDSLIISGNSITGHRDGLYFEFVSHSLIWRNISEKNNRYGLHFMFSNDDTYASNVLEGNGAGVAVMYSKNVRMFHNTFRDNWGDASYGMLLKDITDSYIQGNYFESNTVGIFVDGGTRIQMYRNSLRNNGWGIKITSSSMDVKLNYNDFIGNTFDVGTTGNLVLNDFDHNYWDKYEGYDLDRNRTGDIPYRPVSLYSMIIENNPPALILFRSLISTLMDRSEKILPSITPESLKDNYPLMSPLKLW